MNVRTIGRHIQLIFSVDVDRAQPGRLGRGPAIVHKAKLGHVPAYLTGDSADTFYNHVLTPDQPSCFNGNDVQTGIYTASSAHRGGPNVLLGDGHIELVSETVSGSIWNEFGSRH